MEILPELKPNKLYGRSIKVKDFQEDDSSIFQDKESTLPVSVVLEPILLIVYPLFQECMTRGSTKELFTPSKNQNEYFIQQGGFSGQRVLTIRGNEKGRIELKGRFLIELRDNAFSRTNGEDAVEHIENFLEIVNSLNIPN
ncbi:hypothetical protein Tco_1219737, partial [Tanacetum coccineum]